MLNQCHPIQEVYHVQKKRMPSYDFTCWACLAENTWGSGGIGDDWPSSRQPTQLATLCSPSSRTYWLIIAPGTEYTPVESNRAGIHYLIRRSFRYRIRGPSVCKVISDASVKRRESARRRRERSQWSMWVDIGSTSSNVYRWSVWTEIFGLWVWRSDVLSVQ